MRNFFFILLLALLVKETGLQAQNQRFVVEKAAFSSGLTDEFSPVYYKDGIVFCSNLRDNSPIGYKDDKNRLYKIVFAGRRDSTSWKIPRLFARELTSDFNDGPSTFNEKGNIIYYSRNNSIASPLKDVNDTTNKLGIYTAELVNNIWTNIRPFKYNNTLWTYFSPSLSPDGKRIYFSSDMPGGYGGMDLYFCDSLSDGWDKPVNLGPVINSPKNETFPFAGKYDKLFFASDGHDGFGGKDLFYTQQINGKWLNPVHLDSAINSPADDFSIVTDSTFEKGFFSSNRLKTDDIFSFSIPPVEFKSCDTLRENNYCFTFYDERHNLLDTIPVTYIWEFSDGIKMAGPEVKHCFPGPGKYSVILSIFDNLTGNPISEKVEYKVDLTEIAQPYINSLNVGIAGKSITFDAAGSNLRDFAITDYLWNFGDGFRAGGQFMNKTFKTEGEYDIQLGLLGQKDSLGVIPEKCVFKKIRIYDSYQELQLKQELTNPVTGKSDSAGVQEKALGIRVLFMDDLSERQKIRIKAALKDSLGQVLYFNNYGLEVSALPKFDMICNVLAQNPDIRLELVLHSSIQHPGHMQDSEKWAQEIGFYLRNKGVRSSAFQITGAGSEPPVFKQVVPNRLGKDDLIYIIFMKY